jgi:hypothetical protein
MMFFRLMRNFLPIIFQMKKTKPPSHSLVLYCHFSTVKNVGRNENLKNVLVTDIFCFVLFFLFCEFDLLKPIKKRRQLRQHV